MSASDRLDPHYPELRSDSAADRELLALVRPASWENPEPKGRYNLVVIGAGAGGLISAAGAAGMGAKVALIEENLLGGDCLNVGCVPSKAVIRSAHTMHEVRSADAYGVRVDGTASVDFPAVMERMRSLRARISPVDSAQRYREELGVDVFLGRGAFTSRHSVEVDGRSLRFKKAVIATGARPAVPNIPGLEEAGYHTNQTVFAMNEQPARLLVLGGGPIGVELAQAFARFGTRVTLVEMNDQFLGREDTDAARVLRDVLEREGVDVRLRTRLTRVESTGSEKRAMLESDGRELECAVDAIFVGIGRAPNVEGMGLEEAGVAFDLRTGVEIDDHFRTSNSRIFAVGDVCMSTKFTHAAEFAARAVIRNALFLGRAKQSSLVMPWCTYTDPEIAHVGLYPAQAKERGIAIDTFECEFADVDRAILDGDDLGFVKVHVEKGHDKIVGATIVGRHAGDLISEISVAMAADMGLGALANVIHPYPTQADAIRQCANAFNRTRLTPGVARWFERFLAFTR